MQIVDRNGELLHSLRADKTVRRGQWVALADISPALRTAMVLSEDKRFYEHSGVDWRAVSSAAWGNVWNTKTRGASTITMQLAGLLDEDLKTAAGGRSVMQKVGQTVSAQLLERSWRKDQILEAYLNNVPFRGEMVGIDALSRTLFGKAAHGLDDREAAVTAALVRAPNAKASAVAQRACGVLKVMQPTVKTDCVGLDLYVTAALQRKEFDASSGIAPHVARRVLSSGSARTVTTTLRAPLQRFADQTLNRHLRELQNRNVQDGAIVVLDNATGAVLAYVGSSGELGRSGEVDFVTALRQPGSTLKPFLYAQAIAERRLTAASLLEDSPTHIQTAGGLYIPQNYDRQFKGWVSVRTALGSSLNVPAVRALVMVSPDAFAKQLKTLGLPLKEAGDFYGYSLALGSAEVSLLNLTNAYRSLANGGRVSPTYLTGRRSHQHSSHDSSHRPPRRLHRQRHPERHQRPRPHLWLRQRAGHAVLERRQNRHQQRHARQLGGGLLAALHRGRVGGQRQRRGHVGRERHHRRSARVGGGDAVFASKRIQQSAACTVKPCANSGAVFSKRFGYVGSRAAGVVFSGNRAVAICY